MIMALTKQKLKNIEKRLEKSGKLSSNDIQTTLMGKAWYKEVLYDSLDAFRTTNPDAKIGKIHGRPITGLPEWAEKYI